MKKVHNYECQGVSTNLLLSKFFINSINAEKFPTVHVDLLLSELFAIFVRKEMAMMMKGMMMVMRKVRMRKIRQQRYLRKNLILLIAIKKLLKVLIVY